MMVTKSMNRTTANVLFCLTSLIGTAAGQEGKADPVRNLQSTAVNELVAVIAKAEAAMTSLRMTISTAGQLPGGLRVTTRGELRVLRGTQGKPGDQLFSTLQYAFGEGMKGRMETARTKDGILMFEEDPAFGAVFLHIPAEVVSDLEWASVILKKSDLPGMVDGRAQSPLGSGVISDLIRTFDLQIGEGKEHNGDKGIWLGGMRRAGLDAQDPDLPLADRVEVFVRDRDHAVLLARYFVGKDVVQQVIVEKLDVGAKLGDEDFTVDGHGERVRNVRDYAPIWEQVVEAISGAEAKAKEGDLRPSKRGKAPVPPKEQEKDKDAGSAAGGKTETGGKKETGGK
tara:strand:- start:50763 stop:51785 length:1023 start_codon:yes stop_codon:yes gene_type:complete